MAINDPFSLTYGGFTIGGTSDIYLLSGASAMERDFTNFSFTVGVQVVATTTALLQSQSDALEFAFSNRLTAGDTFVINLDGSAWTYTQGTTILDCEARIVKAGDLETDTGFSRLYTIEVRGELPTTVDNGLQNIRANAVKDAAGIYTVTIAGVYTANATDDAHGNFTTNVDAECALFLALVNNSATFELVDEEFEVDRHKNSAGTAIEPNMLSFTRQYVEVIANQSTALLDDPDIKDHQLIFTLVSRFPGEARADATRLSEVAANFTCAVDKSVTTDLLGVVAAKIRPLILQEFMTLYPASVFTIQNERITIDTTRNRIDAQFSILFQSAGGGVLITSNQAVAYQETRTIDYVPVHEDDELAYNVSLGFATLERVWTRSITTTNPEPVRRRITARTTGGDLFNESIGGESGIDNRDGTQVNQEGWNVIDNRSQVSEQLFGLNADGDSFVLTTLTEQVIERFHRTPTGRGADDSPAIS